MNPWRHKTGWIALVAVLLYGLAPALAAFRPGVKAPVQCSTRPQEEHRCACRMDPHTAGECCCKPEQAEGGCRLTATPCEEPQPGALAPLWTSSHPLPLPEAGPRVPYSRAFSSQHGQPRAFLRPSAAAPLTPPPQPRNSAC